jgi:hypothetical protein
MWLPASKHWGTQWWESRRSTPLKRSSLITFPLGEGRLIAAVGTPVGPDHLVKTLIFYRSSPKERFSEVFKRKDLGAAIRLHGDRLSYTHQEFDASRTRRFAHYQFQNGSFDASDSPQ